MLEEIQRKPRVREWTPQNAPRIRAGVTKKDRKAELTSKPTEGEVPPAGWWRPDGSTC